MMPVSHKTKVMHLIDDTTAGGVMRVLDHLTNSKELAKDADHEVRCVPRGAIWGERTDADVIVSHLSISWRTLPSLIALRLRYPRKKLVHVEHSYTEAFVRNNVPQVSRFYRLLRTAFKRFDKVVAVSEAQGAWLKSEGLVSDEKLTVIRSYVDLKPFESVPRRSGKTSVFGAIGRMDRQKGFDTLIKAFRMTTDPELQLLFFGTGEEESKLRELAKGDDRIVFMGFVASPTEAYELVDAVVMPSRWEAYGLVAIEAISSGRVVICSDVDGLQDHEVLGARLVKDHSAASWRDQLISASNETNPPWKQPNLVSTLGAQSAANWRRLCKT